MTTWILIIFSTVFGATGVSTETVKVEYTSKASCKREEAAVNDRLGTNYSWQGKTVGIPYEIKGIHRLHAICVRKD